MRMKKKKKKKKPAHLGEELCCICRDEKIVWSEGVIVRVIYRPIESRGDGKALLLEQTVAEAYALLECNRLIVWNAKHTLQCLLVLFWISQRALVLGII